MRSLYPGASRSVRGFENMLPTLWARMSFMRLVEVRGRLRVPSTNPGLETCVGAGDGGGRLGDSSLLRLLIAWLPSTVAGLVIVPLRFRVDFRPISEAAGEAMDASSSLTDVPEGSGLILRVDTG